MERLAGGLDESRLFSVQLDDRPDNNEAGICGGIEPLIVYDTHFNLNEWFNVILFTAGYGFLFLTHRRFPPKHTLVYVLYGIAAVTLFDHTLSVAPFDFYDVNDTSRFQWMDFLNYLGFGPISYLYVFLFERFLGESCGLLPSIFWLGR
ncbi:hypothetical protein LJK88_05095 [Paenibacillus sp. P26]|nr:hypothetical protein LJK88_05095 [Paenibacillus sp. P26]